MPVNAKKTVVFIIDVKLMSNRRKSTVLKEKEKLVNASIYELFVLVAEGGFEPPTFGL